MDVKWSFPEPTHSFDALLEDQWVSGDYWDRHQISKRRRPDFPDRFRRRIDALRQTNLRPMLEHRPWLSVRDALIDLPCLGPNNESVFFHNHRYQPGARQYVGHTGSPLDLPAKALKAGDHGVPGGENMMVLDDGEVRYFTVREAALLQTFPDGYVFHGSWTETMRQLGNAVPVKLSQVMASSVAKKLFAAEEVRSVKLIKQLSRS